MIKRSKQILTSTSTILPNLEGFNFLGVNRGELRFPRPQPDRTRDRTADTTRSSMWLLFVAPKGQTTESLDYYQNADSTDDVDQSDINVDPDYLITIEWTNREEIRTIRW